jgi:hypothetical protein
LKTLINLGTYITYNGNIANFNVFNMSVILLLDTGVFSSNMQEQYESLHSNTNRAPPGSSRRSHIPFNAFFLKILREESNQVVAVP